MTLKHHGVPVDIMWGEGCPLIQLARNKLVKRFLTETDADRLIFIDSDIIFSSQDLLQLVYWSMKYDFIGATYPSRKDPAKFFLKCQNNEFEINEDGVMEVQGYGAGFLNIARSVFEKMKPFTEEFETDEEGEIVNEYFDCRIVKRRFKGEDISFMMRWIEDCGGKVWLDPYINLVHVGQKKYDYKLLDYLDSKLERVN